MINKGLSNLAAFFLYLLSLLPLRVLYIFSDILFCFLFYGIKYRRHVVLKNLQNSFPQKNVEELKQIEKKFYAYLSDLIFEIIKMFSASPDYIKKRYTFKNLELIQKYESENQSFLFAVGHYGNWEWNTIVTPLITKAKSVIIYKPMNNKTFDNFFKKAREKSGTQMVAMRQTMRKMIEMKDQLTLTVFASDQIPGNADSYQWITFLNQKTAVFTGIEKIAKSTGYPVVFCDISITKRGHYTAEFVEVAANPKETGNLEITEKYVRLLEDRINETPQYWLWSHKRWKANHHRN